MSSFQKDYVEVYEPEMLGKGFSRKRYVFHRLVNNKIVQKLSYVIFRGRMDFTIQFCFEPLCAGGEITVFMDDYRLGSLIGGELLGRRNMGSQDALRETLEICQKHLFPYFDSVIDYGSYLDYMKEKYRKDLALYNEATRKRVESRYIDGVSSINDSCYHVNIALGNYETALKCRKALLEMNTERTKPTDDYWIKKNQEMADDYESMKFAVENNDTGYIEECIANNEQQALKSYILNFHGKRAFERFRLSGKWL